MHETPDLTTYHLVHRAMRESGDRLAAALAGLPAGDHHRAGALRWWYRGFAGELHAHHTVEDRVFFPALAAEVPAFVAYEEGLAADHEHLADVMSRLGAAIEDLASGAPEAASHAAAVAESAELARFLHDHLALEDDDVLPLFGRHFTAGDYRALDRRALRLVPPRQLAFSVPWVASACRPDELERLLAHAPRPLTVVWRVTRRRHARLTEAALAPQGCERGGAPSTVKDVRST